MKGLTRQENEEYWRKLVEEWKRRSPEIKTRTWCKEHGIKERRFYYWAKRIREQESSSCDVVDITEYLESPALPAAISDAESAPVQIEVNSCKVTVNHPSSESTLRMVLRVLKDA